MEFEEYERQPFIDIPQLPLPQLLIFFVSLGQLDPISFIVSSRKNRDKSYFLNQSLKVNWLAAIFQPLF